MVPSARSGYDARAGRKKWLDPEMLVVLDSLVEPESRGDPMSPLRWTIKSTRTLAGELTRLRHQAGSGLVGRMLHYLGYSLQANSRTQHSESAISVAHSLTCTDECWIVLQLPM
ncbi:MAG: ISAzo13-like element transposase-related protein [Acidimicrobiales bacterium]